MTSLLDQLLCHWVGHYMHPVGVSVVGVDDLTDEQGEPLLFDGLTERCSGCGDTTHRLYRRGRYVQG